MTSLNDVTSALSAGDPEERRRAVTRIAELPPTERLAPLFTALGDGDWRVRKEAIGLTAQLGPEPDLLQALVATFEPGDNVGLRNAAVEALGNFGAYAVEALSGRVAELDADGKKLAIEALGRSGESSAFELLAPLLDDPDPNVRLSAIEAVGAVAAARLDEARPLLLARLAAKHPLETLAALEALANIGAALPFELLEPWLADPLVGHPALALAAQSGDPRVAGPLVRAFVERDPTSVSELAVYVATGEVARRAALAALAGAGHGARSLLLDWLSLETTDLESVRAALRVAGALGIAEAAAPALGWLSDARCYADADHALFLLGKEALPALLRGAASPETELRAAVLDLLGRLAPEDVDPAARSALNSALSSPAPEVVRAALGALTRVGDAECLHQLVRISSDVSLIALVEPALGAVAHRHPEDALDLVQVNTASGAPAHASAIVIAALPELSRTRLGDAALEAFLSRLLTSTSSHERRAALSALGELALGTSLDAVKFALVDEESEVRVEAVRALGKLVGADQARVGVPALLEVVAETSEPELLLSAMRALGESADARAISVLGPLVRSPDARVAVAAVEALARHPDPRRVSCLFDGLHHAEPEVVKASMLAIAAERDPRVVVHLGACLDQPAWDVRRLAADLLGQSPSEASIGLLRARLGVEQDQMVKDALTRALESSGQRRSRPPRRPQGEL